MLHKSTKKTEFFALISWIFSCVIGKPKCIWSNDVNCMLGIINPVVWRKALPLWTCPHIHICSSRNVQIISPKRDRTPQAIQTTRDIPTLPEFFRIPFGEIKIPAPMMVPTMMEIPLSRVTFFPSPTFLSSCGFSLGLLPFWANLCPSEATFPSLNAEEDLSIFFKTACLQTEVSLMDDLTLVEEKLKSKKKTPQFNFLFLIVLHPSVIIFTGVCSSPPPVSLSLSLVSLSQPTFAFIQSFPPPLQNQASSLKPTVAHRLGSHSY